jgi:hypothetical protein
MTDADVYRLLHGPYTPPALRRGDMTECLVRDCDVEATSWTNARIPWPRCQILGQRGGFGILVEAELAIAVCFESALAIRYWCPLLPVRCRARTTAGGRVGVGEQRWPG